MKNSIENLLKSYWIIGTEYWKLWPGNNLKIWKRWKAENKENLYKCHIDLRNERSISRKKGIDKQENIWE